MKKCLIALMLLFINSCAWRSPDAVFYVMDSSDLQALSARKFSVAVAKVKVPEMLNRQQMVVYEENSNEIKVLEFNRWAEALPEMLQGTLTNDLIAYLPSCYVKRTYFDDEKADYSVNVEINQIKAYSGDKVILSAWWNIRDAKGKIVQHSQRTYEAKVKGNTISDLAAAQAEALHLMSRDIAEKLLKL
ncbi:MAG: membrane integrity-associated transporter subunit PqiC [Alphaproteobacteria bacterium]|nr:membrane integrity-associated transporter subunit PqiC [Alphaproteobacteria bacterium]